jgi:hypothetical protein
MFVLGAMGVAVVPPTGRVGGMAVGVGVVVQPVTINRTMVRMEGNFFRGVSPVFREGFCR